MLLEAGIAFCCLLAPPQDPAGDARLRQESAFARALAYDLFFPDLAEVVIDRALPRASGADRSRLLLDRCDIRKLAAAGASDPGEKVDALRHAGEAYQEFLASSPPADLANEARVSLGELAFTFGQTLALHFETSQPSAERRQELIDGAEELFRTALQGLNEVLTVWEQLDEETQDSTRYKIYFPSMFYKAMVYYHWASLYPAGSIERNTHATEAINTLEQFVLLAGDNSMAGFMGYKQMADVYAMQGEAEMAEAFYDHILENCIRPEGEYSPSERDGRERVIQDAYLSYLRFFLDQGQVKRARQLGQAFQDWIENEGIFLKEPGYRCELQIARLAIEDGDIAEAIRLAQMVAAENPQSVLRLEANQVMAEAIASTPPGAEIDLEVLYSAAEGAFLSRKFEECLPLFLELLPRLAGSAQADEYGPATYYYLGRAYGYLDRELEAAVCFEQGYEQFPSDEDYAAKLADLWLKAATRFRDKAPDDPDLNDFYNRAIAAVQATSAAPDEALWRDAESRYEKAKELCRVAAGAGPVSAEARAALEALAGAKEAYDRIERGSRYFERAMIKKALADFRGGAWDNDLYERAYQALADYLNVYVQDPENTPADARGRKIRVEETARADYYLGRIRFEQGAAGDDSAWEKALADWDGYLERHPEQRNGYGVDTLIRSCQALVALGRIPEAVAKYEEIAGGDFDDQAVASAAWSIFTAYNDAAEAAADEATRLDHLRKAADYLHIANSRTARPTWPNLVREARLRLETGEPATAARIFERVLDQFEIEDETTRLFVQLDLIDAYLAQDKTGAAKPILDRIRNPRTEKYRRVLEAAVKVLAGWAEVREGRIVEIPGVGTAEAYQEAAELNTTLQQIAEQEANKAEVNRYRYAPYIQARLQYAYILYRWGLVDPQRKGKHLDLVTSFERLVPDLGAEVCGDEVAQIFRWLKTR
ncbi:MAG: hypothetical protein D6702_02810 [Planctomycetota bacterium]|nr:MAG: hypothetical protein D6702_02810 [Planctomycetota bacterium]